MNNRLLVSKRLNMYAVSGPQERGKYREGENQMFCPKCGTEVSADAKVCPNCNALQGNAKFCKHCGQAIDGECIICPKFGGFRDKANMPLK